MMTCVHCVVRLVLLVVLLVVVVVLLVSFQLCLSNDKAGLTVFGSLLRHRQSDYSIECNQIMCALWQRRAVRRADLHEPLVRLRRPINRSGWSSCFGELVLSASASSSSLLEADKTPRDHLLGVRKSGHLHAHTYTKTRPSCLIDRKLNVARRRKRSHHQVTCVCGPHHFLCFSPRVCLRLCVLSLLPLPAFGRPRRLSEGRTCGPSQWSSLVVVGSQSGRNVQSGRSWPKPTTKRTLSRPD